MPLGASPLTDEVISGGLPRDLLEESILVLSSFCDLIFPNSFFSRNISRVNPAGTTVDAF